MKFSKNKQKKKKELSQHTLFELVQIMPYVTLKERRKEDYGE
ncbi:MAG: hypothetical protein ACTSR2_09515 [Candidatus Hodarchaeales archaeon]